MIRILVLILFIVCSTIGYSQQDSLVVPKIVLLKNDNQLLPLRHLDSLSINYLNNSLLLELGSRYTENEGSKELWVSSVYETETSGKGSGILVIYGDSLNLQAETLAPYQAIIYSSVQDSLQTDLISQMIFGGRAFSDTLTISDYGFEVGSGLTTKGSLRFSFGLPEEVGLDAQYMNSIIDSVAINAIDSGVAPGIQVLVAKDGMVVLHKTYGFQTYDSLLPIKKNILYDFASVTKVTGALPALMQLYDQDKFSLDATMGTYLPYFDKGNKKDLQYRKILSHNARLKSWIPYWTTTLKKNGKFKRKTLSFDSAANYSIKLVDGLYMYNDYRDNIYKQILKSPLNEKPGYVYSGLSFYLYPDIVERLSGDDYETYVKSHIYKPLGASTITYNPMRYFSKDRIIPTEIDTFFRKTALHGVVHDEGAAMMQGVSSNAGLFGTTIDLAKLMQMYLWKGEYGGERYISTNTMELFTSRHYENEGNRRGLAFDKPVLENKENGTNAIDASEHSFGHSGYTGTFAWADPDTGILFIFMSNRVYPTRNNRKLYQLNVRPSMHQAVYDAIIK